ncbi:DUF4159 domain-containing protein [Lutibaculum baratangense]|uniref:Putative membrane protein n=1 Tax=Lutibaculum baratangense AMV1 TaxID=631454 RepID=V4QTR2_9HYPH|nr:DUF4159 domain-containing protein [Lutibaculum baratangense]ESR23157.1 putative membrane protein [Lutibaculum baratangense AMV1]
MIPGLSIGFLQPWLLLGLVALPAIWWLLRFVPPRPRRVAFPPTSILAELERQEDTRSTTPWWLVLLRLVIAALIILALARPTLDPPPATGAGEGTLAVMIDNGWASTPHWPRIQAAARNLLEAADQESRPVILAATASDDALPAADAAVIVADRLEGLEPQPHAPDRARRLDELARAVSEGRLQQIVWLTDGIDHGAGSELADRLAALEAPGGVSVLSPSGDELPLAIGGVRGEAEALTVQVLRASAADAAPAAVAAYDLRGREMVRALVSFGEGSLSGEASVDLPRDLRNEIARVAVLGQAQPGAVELLDDRWRRRVIGLVSGEARDRAQPLLSPLYYVERALEPYADLRPAGGANVPDAIEALLGSGVSMMILTDVGTLIGSTERELSEWIGDGGVLVRFAGPRLAGGESDALLPVPLRGSGRELGGTLSWSEPQAMAPFEEGSPFAGLEIPPDVRIERQILAEPSGELVDHTWASLADGTPLVTARREGEGWIVLFHVTADAAWSNLPLSGVFVEMLRRLQELAGPAQGDPAAAGGELAPGGVLRPFRTLDAEGRLVDPPPSARPIAQADLGTARPNAAHPPGWYGEQDAVRAINLVSDESEFGPLDLAGVPAAAYPDRDPRTLAPWLLAAALALFIVDGLIMLAMSGALARRAARGGATAALVLLALSPVLTPSPLAAQQGDRSFAMRASLETSLAYVVTGNSEVDRTSEAGLQGLSEMLAARTALEPGAPIGVDVERDDLAFFPLIYWPMDHEGSPPSEEAMAKVDAFMKQGGTVLFDTRDALTSAASGTGPGMAKLREMLSGLDIPELEPVPPDHVLTKTFYLVQGFPGRWDDGEMWVEASLPDDGQTGRPVRAADGVSPILITANDMAGAWAIDPRGQPLYPVVPDGNWQREMAYRAGINVVMYALTGNYKADQVHLPALLERLGQ